MREGESGREGGGIFKKYSKYVHYEKQSLFFSSSFEKQNYNAILGFWWYQQLQAYNINIANDLYVYYMHKNYIKRTLHLQSKGLES